MFKSRGDFTESNRELKRARFHARTPRSNLNRVFVQQGQDKRDSDENVDVPTGLVLMDKHPERCCARTSQYSL